MGGYVKPGDLPHDLAQFVAEASLGLQYGFWGLVAEGATFKSTGRKVTRPGRHVIVEHRADLTAAEHAVNAEVTSWRLGGARPASIELTAMASRWDELPVGGVVMLTWPPPRNTQWRRFAPMAIEAPPRECD